MRLATPIGSALDAQITMTLFGPEMGAVADDVLPVR